MVEYVVLVHAHRLHSESQISIFIRIAGGNAISVNSIQSIGHIIMDFPLTFGASPLYHIASAFSARVRRNPPSSPTWHRLNSAAAEDSSSTIHSSPILNS